MNHPAAPPTLALSVKLPQWSPQGKEKEIRGEHLSNTHTGIWWL